MRLTRRCAPSVVGSLALSDERHSDMQRRSSTSEDLRHAASMAAANITASSGCRDLNQRRSTGFTSHSFLGQVVRQTRRHL